MWAKCAAEGCFSTNYDALKAAHACRGAASWTIFICHRTPKRCWIAPTLRRSNALFSRMLHVASPLLTHTHTERGRGGSRNQNQRLDAQLHRHIFRHVVNTEHRIVRVDSTAVLKPFWFCAILHLNVCGGHLSVPYTSMRNRCFASSMQQLATVPAICGGTKGREHRQVKHRSFRLNLLRFKLWRFQHIRADQCRNSSDLHWIALSTLQPCSRTSLMLGIKQEQLMLCYQFAILHIDKPDRRNLSSHWHPHSARQTFWTVASCRATPWRVACPKTLSLGFGRNRDEIALQKVGLFF